jgi:hypothetical protein
MPAIIIVEANGTLKEQSVRSIIEGEMYKKAGLKSADGFVKCTTWNVPLDGKTYDISLYGKTTGRAGQENKYDFPPPVDSVLYFGKCVLVNNDGDLKMAEWNRAYEHLFGGFDEIGADDSEEEEEELEDGAQLTKAGYLKDDFVVDDDDEEDDEPEEEEEEEVDDVSSEEEDKAKGKVKGKQKGKTKAKPKPKAKPKAKVKAPGVSKPSYLDCTEELEEETYL